MTIDDKFRCEKLQYDINKEAAKISVLSLGKINKYVYLTGEEILPCDQSKIIEQAKFTCSPLGKAFEKQIKTIEDQAIKQVEEENQELKSIEVLFSKKMRNNEIKNRKDEIKKWEEEMKKIKDLKHEAKKYINDFQ